MQAASSLSVAALHPAIRIIFLLFLCIASASANHAQLLFTFLLLSVGFGLGQIPLLIKTLKLFYRLKWLFISILLVYLFLTPNSSPNGHFAAFEAGVIRIASLLLLIAAVNLLVQSASPSEFLAGLLWLMAPLQKCGVPTHRIAVRMALTLEMIPQLQNQFQNSNPTLEAKPIRKDLRHYVAGLANIAAERVQTTLSHIECYCISDIEIVSLSAPNLLQILLLLGLMAIYVDLGWLFT